MRPDARWHAVALRAREERGVAVVYVLVLLVLVLAFGAAALTESISSRRLTTRDARERRAQQAADAGVQSNLYLESESNLGAPYNFTGGTLGVSGFLDCHVPSFNASGQMTGVSVSASTNGYCPTVPGSGGSFADWTAVGNHSYYQSEVISNKKEIGGSGFGAVVEFPQIVGVGCDTTDVTTCSSNASTNAYSRELAILAPAGPLQALEAMGKMTINGLSALGLSTTTINGDLATDGQLTLPTLSSAINVGNAPPSTVISTFAAGSFNPANPVTTAKLVTLSGFCTSNNPSTTCLIKRPAPVISATSCSACSTGITCSSCTGGYSTRANGAPVFNLTAGTATFSGGDYVFCSFSATGTSKITASPTSTQPVRIFVLSPNTSPCSSGSDGNFTAANGIGNGLTGTVNGTANAIDPSGVQVIVAGDGSYDNNTTVSVGDSDTCTLTVLGVCKTATAPTDAMIIYAPTSAVTLNTGNCVVGILGSCTLGVAGAFVGNIVGDNVTITAASITQDLDIGNFPVYTGGNAFRPTQYVQCSTSQTNLSGSSSDTSGC